ncbi:MAG: hypothetical protein HUK04_02865 [Bacteroidaceae bacterium]|nr:hypothetical protein [Bacteroidaceae bacterium]
MRTIITTVLLVFTLAATAQTTSELRYKYVEKHLGLDKPTFDKLAPTLKAYIKAMKEAGDIYDDVKDEYKSQIKGNKLSDKQAAKLNAAKLKSEAKELEVKNAYYTKFQTVIAERYIFKLFKLASDKKSKFESSDKKKKKADDDED